MTFHPHLLAASIALAACGVAAPRAAAQQTPEQLRAAYDETVRQLQESQDRKNQLANENEQLKARVAELEARLVAIEAGARQAAFLRAQSAAWSAFLQRYPILLKRFEDVLAGPASLAAPPSQAVTQIVFFDPEWPFSVVSLDEASGPSTAPASGPTSSPTTSSVTAHWCALCAAAASRRASADRPAGDGLFDAASPSELIDELIESLPPQ